MKKKLLCILCVGALLLGAAACGAKEDKQKKASDAKEVSAEASDETKTKDEEESKSLDEGELNQYGVTDAQLQVFVDNVKAAVTEEYLKPNNIDPATFSLPPVKVPMTEEDMQEIEEVFWEDEEKAAQIKKIGEKINQFWNAIVRQDAYKVFEIQLMSGSVSDTVQPLWGDVAQSGELAGVTDGWKLADILFREFVEWYKEVVCADGVIYEPMKLIYDSESIETWNYNGDIRQESIGWYTFFSENISFE